MFNTHSNGMHNTVKRNPKYENGNRRHRSVTERLTEPLQAYYQDIYE